MQFEKAVAAYAMSKMPGQKQNDSVMFGASGERMWY